MQKKTAKSADRREPAHIKDLKPDPRNARKHTSKNIGMISDSLRAVGAARSIVIDENDEILAGNGVIEGAAEAGITKLKIVEADGNTIIAVRRRGLTPEQKTKLALYDNRTAELAEWDLDVLKEFAVEGLDLTPFEFDASMLKQLGVEPADASMDADVHEQFLIVVTCQGEREQHALLDRFLAEGLTCRALVS
jgi:hypothetical protein